MSEQIIRYVHAREIPGSTPGQPGGAIAVVVDDLGVEHPMGAAQYRAQEHERIRALDLWKELRFLVPSELHPDDFRSLYPDQKALTDDQIREMLHSATKRLEIRA